MKKSISKESGLPEMVPWKYYLLLAVILLITFIAYFPVLNNGLLNWDDNSYIRDNPLIYSMNLVEIFSRPVMSNYHPFTILVLAVEYHLFGLDPTGFHAVNLFLHLLNVILVFQAVRFLSRNLFAALITALLFGIHPVHVESVAWVAELKDLLYTFFFLLSFVLYLNYLKGMKGKYYLLALIFFIVSLLSKAMAASLPVILVLTDYFTGRKMDRKAWLEKVPFFLLALLFGLLAVFEQSTSGATDMVALPFIQRIVFACYAFITYFLKLVFPLHLSAYYPYPVRSGEGIPILYFAYVALVLVFAALLVYLFLKSRRKVVFGLLFFTITVFLVLQLLPVGGTVMADRYAYLPSLGIFYLAGEGFVRLWDSRLRVLAIALLCVFSVFFIVKTWTRCEVWKSDMALWDDVIDQYQNVPYVYFNRGLLHANEDRNAEAVADYSRAIELKPAYTLAYNNRGNALLKESRYDEALKDFTKAIELEPGYAWSYFNRGVLLMNQNRNSEALDDFTKLIKLQPTDAEAYFYRGNIYVAEKRIPEALDDFTKVIELRPGYAEAYNNRGFIFLGEGRNNEAINDFSRAIDLKPGYAEAYCNRGLAFFREKRLEEAISNYTQALALKSDYVMAYFNRGVAEYYAGRKEAACADLEQAAGLGYRPAEDAIKQICR